MFFGWGSYTGLNFAPCLGFLNSVIASTEQDLRNWALLLRRAGGDSSGETNAAGHLVHDIWPVASHHQLMCLRLILAEACSAWGCLHTLRGAGSLQRTRLLLLPRGAKCCPSARPDAPRQAEDSHILWQEWEHVLVQELVCCSGAALLQAGRNVRVL